MLNGTPEATPNQHGAEAIKTELDPVCGMRVASRADRMVSHAGHTYYFCSPRCVEKFSQNPAQFLTRDLVPPTPTPSAGVIYPCPMHPQVRVTHTGDCPLCGMRLEPLLATPNVMEDDGELRDLTHHMWVSLAFAVPLMVITMGESLPWLNLQHRFGANLFNWLQLSLATPVVLWGGWSFFVRAWVSFKTWRLNMFSLIGLGTAAAYLFSMVAMLLPALLPQAFKQHGMSPLYFEASAVIIALVLVGQVLELRARARTQSAIKALLELTPTAAIRIEADGREVDVPLDHHGEERNPFSPSMTKRMSKRFFPMRANAPMSGTEVRSTKVAAPLAG